MDREQCHRFTVICLGSHSSNRLYTERISSLYQKYNKDNDDLLKFDEFLEFYEDAALDRPATVWSNLRSFGVKGSFRFTGEGDDDDDMKEFPRSKLTENKEFYKILFSLLENNELAPQAFSILERLPVPEEI